MDGDIVTLIDNIELGVEDKITSNGVSTLLAVEGKSITLDMNGKSINARYDNNVLLYSVVCVASDASLKITGNGMIDLTIGNTMVGSYECVAYMFLKRGSTGSLVIENGYYHANSLEDSMIYTNGDEIVTVNGGTFILDEAGERDNGSLGFWL